MELLEKVALARLGLVGALHLVCAKYKEQCKDEDKKLDLKRREVFAHLIEIFGGNRNTDVHMFILRHIIRFCGNRGLRTVIEESQFEWLELDLNSDNNMVRFVSIWVLLESIISLLQLLFCMHSYLQEHLFNKY